MRSAGVRVACFAAVFLVRALTGHAADEIPWTESFLKEFKQIKEQLTRVESSQAALVKREDDALKEIDQIRKWAVKNPGKPHP